MNLRDFFTLSTWWGKSLGAVFGFLAAGPVGAIFGILIGHFFDRGLSNYYTNPHYLYYAEQRAAVQKIFFESTFLIMGHIAKADGRVSPQEINIAKILMQEMHLSREQKEIAKQLFNAGKQKQFNPHTVLVDLKKACHANRELLQLFIDIQYRAAQADSLSTQKITAFNAVLSALGFAPLTKQHRFYGDFSEAFHTSQQQQRHSSQQQSQQKRPSQSTSLQQAYALLEVSPEANKNEVKRAYRRLLSRNHPDKLTAQGLPEGMIKMANEKTHAIMKAYQLICENKGW